MNWQELAMTSHYQTAVAVKEAMQQGDVADAAVGLQELIDALARADKRAVRSFLIRLMTHVIKWRSQPERRSRSWRTTIHNCRREIQGLQEDTPSLNRAVIESLWNSCFEQAKEEAETEMNQDSEVSRLTWNEVFDKVYEL